MRKIIFAMVMALCCLTAAAQATRVVTGAVIDKNGNPLPNALVEATGGAESVTTDADGTFSIEVPIWLKSLTAKYSGLKDKRISLNGRSNVIFEMKPLRTGVWFVDAVGSINTYEGDDEFGRLGVMGGYLGNWGGYAKIMLPFAVHDAILPTATIGVTKRITNPVYFYLGAGYTPVYSYLESGYGSFSYSYDNGAMFEAGFIFKIKKINFSVGYGYSNDFDWYDNHSIQASVGYCF